MSATLYVSFPRPAPRHGQPWSEDELAYLVKAVRRGDDVGRICDLLGRPYSGVVSKLTRLYLLRWVATSHKYEWVFPKAHRRGWVPKHRDDALAIRPDEFRKMRRFCKLFLTGSPV